VPERCNMCVQSVADHADGFPHEALMIRPLLHVHVVCFQIRGRVLAGLFTLRWVDNGGSGGQAVERQTKRARGKRNGCPLLFLLSYAEHEERSPQARQNTFQNVQSQVASRKPQAARCGPTAANASPSRIGALITYVELRLQLTLLISTAPNPQGTRTRLHSHSPRTQRATYTISPPLCIRVHPPSSSDLTVKSVP
jgi:hypothetical protein